MSTEIIADRMAPVIDREFIAFLIGMRVNKWWQLGKWLRTGKAMGTMLKELEQRPDMGLLHAYNVRSGRNFMVIQYWESFEKLHQYANNPDAEHRPAWTDFYRYVGLKGDVGIWHETYAIKPGQVEAVYGNMPKFGLGTFLDLEKATGRYGDALNRMKAPTEADAAE